MNDHEMIMRLLKEVVPKGVSKDYLLSKLEGKGFTPYILNMRLVVLKKHGCVAIRKDERTRKSLVYYIKDFQYIRNRDFKATKLKVLDFLKENPPLSFTAIFTQTHCSYEPLRKALDELVKSNLICTVSRAKTKTAKYGITYYYYYGNEKDIQ